MILQYYFLAATKKPSASSHHRETHQVRLLRFFKPLHLLVAGIMVSLKTAGPCGLRRCFGALHLQKMP